MPVISILIRHYNQAGQLEKCLTSAFDQTRSFLETDPSVTIEVLLIDDGSSAKELRSLKKVLRKFKEARFLPLEHKGAIKALNLGIKECRGEWYTILDCDDQLPPNSLSKLWSPKFKFSYGDYLEFYPDNTDSIRRVSTKENIFNTLAGGIIFNKLATTKVGNYDESLFFPEYDLLMKLGIQNGKHVDEIVYHYYRNRNSLTSSKTRVLQGRQQLYKKYGRDLPIRDYDL
jgi:glycosyltransferase involved in cell wall biosynthesis